MPRPKTSDSPLARPETAIHHLASQVQRHLYFPTPDPLYVVLGCLAGNVLKGAPVWVMLVGPPASGRTVLLETLEGIPKVWPVSAIRSPAALLSGTSKKDTAKDATGGLLRQVGANGGLIVMKDFTGMLSLPKDPLMEVMGALREVYDGHWSRPVGVDGGRVLHWYGKAGLLAACTPAIDGYHYTIGELGERWMYYRYGVSDGWGETMSVLGAVDPQETKRVLREMVGEFFELTGLDWSEGCLDRRRLTEQESGRLFAVASLAAACRSTVKRDYKSLEIIEPPFRETPTRMSAALGQLYLGLEAIGLGERERWRIVGRVGLDSMPAKRLIAVQRLREVASARTGEVEALLRCSAPTTRRVMEDLEIHGVVEKVGKSGGRMGEKSGEWALTEWAKRVLGVGWGGQSAG